VGERGRGLKALGPNLQNELFRTLRLLFFISLQLQVMKLGAIFDLSAAQVDFDIRKFGQKEIEFLAWFQVIAEIAAIELPFLGAQADGAIGQTTASLATRAFLSGQEPLQGLAEFDKAEAVFLGETMVPPIGAEAVDVLPEFGHGFLKVPQT